MISLEDDWTNWMEDKCTNVALDTQGPYYFLIILRRHKTYFQDRHTLDNLCMN